VDIADCKVLIVDDDIDLAELLVESFELEDFYVDKVLCAEEALERCKSNHYDVIISDQNMKEMNGLQLLEKLNVSLKKKFLFYLSTGDIVIDKEDFKGMGGTDIIAKPYDLFDFIERIGQDLKGI